MSFVSRSSQTLDAVVSTIVNCMHDVWLDDRKIHQQTKQKQEHEQESMRKNADAAVQHLIEQLKVVGFVPAVCV